MKLFDLGFNALLIDTKAIPFLQVKGLMSAVEAFGQHGRIYILGESEEFQQLVQRSGGAFLPTPKANSLIAEDLTSSLREKMEVVSDLPKIIGIKPGLLRTQVLYIKHSDKKVLTDMPGLYGYSFEEYQVKKDCYLRLVAHGFENCIHGCTYCYANYAYDTPTTVLINAPERLSQDIKEFPFRELIQQGFVVNIGSVTDLCSEVSLSLGILQDFLQVLRGINTLVVTKCPSFARSDVISCFKAHGRTKVTFTFTNLPSLELNLPYNSRYFPEVEIRQAIHAGIDVSLLYRPLITGMNDDESRVIDTLQQVKKVGIKHVSIGFIRINHRIYPSVSSSFPSHAQYILGQVVDKFGDDLYPALEYRLRMAQTFKKYCDVLGITLSFCQGYLGEYKEKYANYYCLCQKERWLS